jgi:hypothetical protein
MFPEMLTGVPSGTSTVLDMTAEFAPLLIGLYALLVVCIGGLVLSSLYLLPGRTAQPLDKIAVPPTVVSDMSEAA